MEQRELTPEKKDKGFTLVELLIVIVILGILATVTVFAVSGITQNAKDNTCKTELAEVQTAVEAYYAANDATAFPTQAELESASYFRQALKGTYTIDSTGQVSVTSYDGANITDCNA